MVPSKMMARQAALERNPEMNLFDDLFDDFFDHFFDMGALRTAAMKQRNASRPIASTRI
jgi:hypothetical protein